MFMRLAGITSESFVDGPGVRFVIFTQGCPHQCPYCHNPESWAPNSGKEFAVREIIYLLEEHKDKKRGITFSGGEPFLQATELTEVALFVREMGWDVVTYTGYTYEQLIAGNDLNKHALLLATDILIDGKYVHSLRNLELAFRGSSNQRLINMVATQKHGKVILWQGS